MAGTATDQKRGLSALLGYWMRQTKRLFHMLVALAFMVLTLVGVTMAHQLWTDYRKSPDQGLLSFDLVSGFTAFLFILCLYSFAKARSVR